MKLSQQQRFVISLIWGAPVIPIALLFLFLSELLWKADHYFHYLPKFVRFLGDGLCTVWGWPLRQVLI